MKALTIRILSIDIRSILVRAISLGLAGLLCYTATKKILDLEAFAAHLELLPKVSKQLALRLSWFVVLQEYGLALALLFGPNKRIVYKLAIALVLLYTLYIFYILNFAPFLPCSCQGAFKSLSWEAHYGVNAGVMALLGLTLYFLYQTKRSKDETV